MEAKTLQLEQKWGQLNNEMAALQDHYQSQSLDVDRLNG